MFHDVVLPGMSLDQWQSRRVHLRKQILGLMGNEPASVSQGTYQVLSTQVRHGLTMEEIRFPVLPDLTASAVLVYPPEPHSKHPAAVCIHGTSDLGRYNVIDPDQAPKRAYGLELARRGFMVITADQFGFGDFRSTGQTHDECVAQFYKRFPDWSLDGIRLLIQRRAVDVLCTHPLVDAARIATIGNSLGGRLSLFLGALDDRIAMTVASTGVSPNITNVFRNQAQHIQHDPQLNQAIYKDGKPPWEYADLIALVAPRGLLMLEPFNDPNNPYVEAVTDCFQRARKVWELYENPGNLCLLCHGRGHDTPDDIRDFAYSQIERTLAS